MQQAPTYTARSGRQRGECSDVLWMRGERGCWWQLMVELDDDALNHLVDVANGDARAVLNALELAVETTPADGNGVRRVVKCYPLRD